MRTEIGQLSIVSPKSLPAALRIVVRGDVEVVVREVAGFIASSDASSETTGQAVPGPWSGRKNCGHDRPDRYIWHVGQGVSRPVHYSNGLTVPTHAGFSQVPAAPIRETPVVPAATARAEVVRIDTG